MACPLLFPGRWNPTTTPPPNAADPVSTPQSPALHEDGPVSAPQSPALHEDGDLVEPRANLGDEKRERTKRGLSLLAPLILHHIIRGTEEEETEIEKSTNEDPPSTPSRAKRSPLIAPLIFPLLRNARKPEVETTTAPAIPSTDPNQSKRSPIITSLLGGEIPATSVPSGGSIRGKRSPYVIPPPLIRMRKDTRSLNKSIKVELLTPAEYVEKFGRQPDLSHLHPVGGRERRAIWIPLFLLVDVISGIILGVESAKANAPTEELVEGINTLNERVEILATPRNVTKIPRLGQY